MRRAHAELCRGLACGVTTAFLLVTGTPAGAARAWAPAHSVEVDAGYVGDSVVNRASEQRFEQGAAVGAAWHTLGFSGWGLRAASRLRLLRFDEPWVDVPIDLSALYAIDVLSLVPELRAGFSSALSVRESELALSAGFHAGASLAYALDFDHQLGISALARHWIVSGASFRDASSWGLDASVFWRRSF